MTTKLKKNSNYGQSESSPVTTPTIGMGLKGSRAGLLLKGNEYETTNTSKP